MIRNIKNQKFGTLIAIEPTSKREKRSVVWRCICTNCGNYKEISEVNLVHGDYKSCGCLKKEHADKIRTNLHFYEGTCLEFLKRKQKKNNSSGYTGVEKVGNRYRANITFMRTRYNLGTYKTIEEAVVVRKKAEEELFSTFIRCYKKWLQTKDKEEPSSEFVFHVERANGVFKVIHN